MLMMKSGSQSREGMWISIYTCGQYEPTVMWTSDLDLGQLIISSRPRFIMQPVVCRSPGQIALVSASMEH